ncbi:hypothetical protein HLB44_33120 [Aquincola sp. S2]|uniref:Uncharacterized protein n=1 Tax=Pseudaquabacterium terrae TaxID=2732868 RepID=A0ABX2ET08_9BURK|nr:hypothetical protein [Aquabacterium terrae]NRF71839.1 hypothetical protein [Aquabacterium terrae]
MQFKHLTLAAALAAACAAAHADVPLPVHVLSSAETGALSGMSYLSPANQTFHVAAVSHGSAYNKATIGVLAQRKTGTHAAVYRGTPVTSPALYPTGPSASDMLDFITTGDLSQSWATMTADGIPYLRVTGFGEFMADASASWNTRLTLPAVGSREVVLRFVIPPVSVAGATEQEGIAHWRARMRADVLVNGYPAWSTEALRLTLDPKIAYSNLNETIVLQQFGDALSFPTNDEDTPLANGGPNNDSGPGNVSNASTKRTVYLSLGRFDANAVVDLSMTLRASATSVPKSSGLTDNRCKYSQQLDRYFCSRGSVSVDGSAGEVPRIYLLP